MKTYITFIDSIHHGVKVSTLKLSTDLMQFQSKCQAGVFADTYKLILKLIWKDKRTRIAKTILKKRRRKLKSSQYTIFNLALSYSNQDSVVLWRDRHMYQWNRAESRKRPIQIQPIEFWQGYKTNSMEKGSPFQ